MSPLGVITAADDEHDEHGEFQLFCTMKRAVTTPIFARKKTTAGIWKTRPMASSIFV